MEIDGSPQTKKRENSVMPRELTNMEIEHVTKALTTESSSSFISAVKLYRRYSGKGLKECKKAVDDIVAELQRLEPDKYSYLSKRGKGCMAVLVLFLVITTLVVLLLTTNVLSAIISLLK